jgi:hypothetical protein
MPDPDKPMEEPKLGKGRRRAAVIDLQAEEVRTVGEPSAEAATTAAVAPEAVAPETPASEKSADGSAATDAAAAPQEPAAATPPGPGAPAAEPAREEASPRVEPINVPPAPEPGRPSLVLPLATAAGLGLIFGAVGGIVAPRFLASDDAESAKIAIIERTQQQMAKDQAGLASMAELDKVRQAITRLEAQAAQRPAPAAEAPVTAATLPPAIEERIAGLESNLKALADRPAPAAAPTPPAVDLKPLQDQIGAIQAKVAEIDAAAAERNALQTQVAALDAALKELAGRIDGAAKAAEAAPRAAQQAVNAALDPKLAAIGQRVDQAEQRLEASRAAPLFAAVQALAQTFHRGAPFATELTAVEALGAPAGALQPLKPFAERGAPTPQRLQESFAGLAGRLAGDASQPGLMGYVSRFVTVRPTEESASATPAAIVGSIEAALRRGDVPAAVANWNRLPEPARSASAEWGAQATRRAEAAKALSDLQASSAAALRK